MASHEVQICPDPQEESVPFRAPLSARFALVLASFPSLNMFTPKKTLPDAISLVTFAKVSGLGKRDHAEA